MALVVTKSPSECTRDELAAFERLVIKGGEVNPQGLANRIKRAQYLAFLYTDNDQLVGIGALKRPNLSYKQKVFKNAGSPDNYDEFALEIGWLFIETESRGQCFSRLLMEALLKIADNTRVFATTREKNEPMRRTNERFGFKQSGSSYKSSEGNYKLILFIR